MPTTAPIRELVEGKAMVVPLTVEQYHRMIETGIQEEGAPIELLDGFLVRKDRSAAGEDPRTIGHHHAWALEQLDELLSDVRNLGARLRIQQPITLWPDNEPEPDAVIAIGGRHTFRDRHPGPRDISCVIEVSDSSLGRDRTTKQRIYAEHGIKQYVIINLIDGLIEEYLDPMAGAGHYGQMNPLHRGSLVRFRVSDEVGLDVPVASLLP